jgi:hypothetical protein
VNPETIASLTTAAGTLILAVATFSATRSANRASRTAEQSLLAGLQPVLMNAQVGDPMQKVGFSDQHWVRLVGPGAALEHGDGNVYLAIALRNAGSGIGVLQGWYPRLGRVLADVDHAAPEDFRPQVRDLYVPPGSVGFWQGAFRDPNDPLHEQFSAAAENHDPVTIELLYTDLHGGQRTITRFTMIAAGEDKQTGEVKWLSVVSKHWLLDGVGPR